jgi:hypothetical protein
MTLGEIKDIIANRLGDTSTNTGDRIVEFINDIMFRISDEVQYPGEIRWGQIRTESGRFSYPLDPDVASVIEPMIVADSNANIWMTPVETFNANVQNPTSTGVPHNFMYYGNYTLDRQPESKLTFTDPNTADITATIYGMSEFRNITESLELAVGEETTTVNTFQTVSKISLSAAPADLVVNNVNVNASNGGAIARFTSTDTDANTSAYGLWNPGSRVRFRQLDTGTLLANEVTRIRGYTTALGDSGFFDEMWGIEGPKMGADTTAAGGLGGTDVNTNNGEVAVDDPTVTITSPVSPLIVVGSNISIGSEQMRVTGINSLVLTVIRGIFDTTVAVHATGQNISVTNNCHAETSARFTSIESASMEDNQQTLVVSSLDEYGQSLTKTGDYGRILGVIPFLRQSVDRPIIGLYPIPGGERVSYQYYRKMFKITNDSDRPPMDERVHRYIMKWSETAVLAWYGDSMGINEVIQISTPSWRQDMQSIRNLLGLSANPEVVIGGRARNISRQYGPSAMLDPAHYSN